MCADALSGKRQGDIMSTDTLILLFSGVAIACVQVWLISRGFLYVLESLGDMAKRDIHGDKDWYGTEDET